MDNQTKSNVGTYQKGVGNPPSVVGVVVVTYNGSHWIKQCLGSIKKDSITTRAYVIDNASSDNTVSMVKENFPSAKLFTLEKNIGFGQANNIGMCQAISDGCDFILLLNQDAWFSDGSLSNLMEGFLSSEIDVISPIHLCGEGAKIDRNFFGYLTHGLQTNDTNRMLYRDALLGQLKKSYPSNFLNAACWLFKSSLVEEVGLFDPFFFHYGEDTNYYQRLRFFQKSMGVVPTSFVFHDREGRRAVDSQSEPQLILELKRKLSDINFHQSFSTRYRQYVRHYYLRSAYYLLRGNFSESKKSWAIFRALIRLKPQLIKSINRNVNLQYDSTVFLSNYSNI